MRRLTLALVVLLLLATPALGDDVTKKHQVDAKITSLQARLAAHKRQEEAFARSGRLHVAHPCAGVEGR